MKTSDRKGERRSIRTVYSITWSGPDGAARSAEVKAIDVSGTGMRVECAEGIQPGVTVFVQSKDSVFAGHSIVRHCTPFGESYRIGLEYCSDAKTTAAEPPTDEVDYYDVLQISPKAEAETIQRVYRIVAARFHPDNPETGDLERFLLLTLAYEVLSDPERRAKYDEVHASRQTGPDPIFELKDFVEGVKGELNRRVGVLSLLYNQRRIDPEHPSISLLEMEKRMAFPREYLNFTMWYLRCKELVTQADNSDFTLTAQGADYVEEHSSDSEMLSKLITGGCWTPPSRPRKGEEHKEQARVAAKMLRLESPSPMQM